MLGLEPNDNDKKQTRYLIRMKNVDLISFNLCFMCDVHPLC